MYRTLTIYITYFFAAIFMLSSDASASACANNSTAISSNCGPLEITSPNLTVTVDAGVSVSASEAVAAIRLQTGALNTSLVNNGTIANTNILDFRGGQGLLATTFANDTQSYFSSIINTGVIRADGVVGLNGLTNNIRGIMLNNGQGIRSLVNTGTISGMSFGIYNMHTLTTLDNSGSIIGTGRYAIQNLGQIFAFTNSGNMVGGLAGVNNGGTITTLNNAQGSVSALQFSGRLPANYNIIINSSNNFGTLSVVGSSGSSTNFGIYPGSTVRNGIYAAVLSGITGDQILNKSGTYGDLGWKLSPQATSSTIWDLFFSPLGPSIANTNQSLLNTASELQRVYKLQNSVVANSFSYDCNVFGANNVCVSAGGRNSSVSSVNGLNNKSGLIIAAYLPHPNYRIGAYADQNISVSNPDGAVNLDNSTPLIGLFGVWNQRLNGTGAEVKVSVAHGQKNTTVTRFAVGSGNTASEAGSGTSTLNSQGAQVTARYGFAVADNLIVSPYVGIRYTQNNMGGYTEGASNSVTAPLAYSALKTNASTALARVEASYRVIPTVTAFTNVGVETDTNTSNGTYTATNASIGDLNPVNFNANPVKTRSTAMLGAYYDVAKNQRLVIIGIYRQEPYQASSTTTVMATYTIGL